MTTQRRPAARRNQSRDLIGRLATQSGPRTTAPMWARPLFTPGEWAVYTALWSYPNDSVIPTYQDLCNRAWVERPTAIAAVTKMNKLGLLEKEASEREEDGGQSSNTYFLIEIPTPALLKNIAEETAKRQKEQDDKRRKRKAANRKYEKTQVGPADGGATEAAPLPERQGGSIEVVPPGVDADITPGGSLEIAPQGVGQERTHETLGVTDVISLEVRPTSSAEPQQQKVPDSPKIEHQEDETSETVMKPRVLPTLTAWEEAVIEECLPLAGRRWDRLSVRKVLGSKRVRDVTERDPELVRRAFLIGAASNKGHSVTVPKRMWHTDWCPHWAQAEKELAAERAGSGGAESESPAPTPVPVHRVMASPSPLQESAREEGPVLSRAEAMALAAAKIAAGKVKAGIAAEPRVSHAARMAQIDLVLQESNGA